MTPKDLFAVGVLVIGLWFLCVAAVSLLGAVIGPFAHLIIGVILLIVGRSLLNGRRSE